MKKQPDEQYSKEETQRRFDAALRGARLAAARPLKTKSPKRGRRKPRYKTTSVSS